MISPGYSQDCCWLLHGIMNGLDLIGLAIGVAPCNTQKHWSLGGCAFFTPVETFCNCRLSSLHGNADQVEFHGVMMDSRCYSPFMPLPSIGSTKETRFLSKMSHANNLMLLLFLPDELRQWWGHMMTNFMNHRLCPTVCAHVFPLRPRACYRPRPYPMQHEPGGGPRAILGPKLLLTSGIVIRNNAWQSLIMLIIGCSCLIVVANR